MLCGPLAWSAALQSLFYDRCQTEGMANEQADEQREKFRQALEAKKNKGQRNGQGPTGTTGAVKDTSNRAGGKREHRRKSG